MAAYVGLLTMGTELSTGVVPGAALDLAFSTAPATFSRSTFWARSVSYTHLDVYKRQASPEATKETP